MISHSIILRASIPCAGIGLCLFVLAACGNTPTSAPEPLDITMDRPDGTSTQVTLYPVEDTGAPGLILSPMARRDRASLHLFARRAQRAGIMTVSHDIDMGEGSQLDPADIERVLADIHGARALLVERGAAPRSVAVMGASLGANLVLRYALEYPGVAAVVLVSPGEEYHGVTIDASDGDSWKWPMLLMISSGDAYAAATGREMNRTAPGYVELREYDGSAHGTDLLDRSEQANEQVLLWLSQIIGPHRDTGRYGIG